MLLHSRREAHTNELACAVRLLPLFRMHNFVDLNFKCIDLWKLHLSTLPVFAGLWSLVSGLWSLASGLWLLASPAKPA
jgi:hypothetical protein